MKMFSRSRKNMVSNGKARILPFLLTLTLFLSTGMGVDARQTDSDRTLSVNMAATEYLPADLIVFTINLNAEADSPQQAFEDHKKKEELLAGLLKKHEIDTDNIRFEPVRMNKRYRNNEESMVTQTSQQVSVTFSDFSLYEEIQITLIKNGFDSFDGRFSSTTMEEGKEKALISAIELAKEKAELISETAGLSLKGIQSLSYSDHQIRYPQASRSMDMVMAESKSGMMDFEQQVSVTANISVVFRITDK